MCSTSSRSFCSANWRPAQYADSIQARWYTTDDIVFLLCNVSTVTIQAPQDNTTNNDDILSYLTRIGFTPCDCYTLEPRATHIQGLKH
eukprot:6120915-Amphidinium_carterae.1